MHRILGMIQIVDSETDAFDQIDDSTLVLKKSLTSNQLKPGLLILAKIIHCIKQHLQTAFGVMSFSD